MGKALAAALSSGRLEKFRRLTIFNTLRLICYTAAFRYRDNNLFASWNGSALVRGNRE